MRVRAGLWSSAIVRFPSVCDGGNRKLVTANPAESAGERTGGFAYVLGLRGAGAGFPLTAAHRMNPAELPPGSRRVRDGPRIDLHLRRTCASRGFLTRKKIAPCGTGQGWGSTSHFNCNSAVAQPVHHNDLQRSHIPTYFLDDRTVARVADRCCRACWVHRYASASVRSASRRPGCALMRSHDRGRGWPLVERQIKAPAQH